jgi:hypothetical protein
MLSETIPELSWYVWTCRLSWLLITLTGCRKPRNGIAPIRSHLLFCHDICYLRTKSIYTPNVRVWELALGSKTFWLHYHNIWVRHNCNHITTEEWMDSIVVSEGFQLGEQLILRGDSTTMRRMHDQRTRVRKPSLTFRAGRVEFDCNTHDG